MKTIDLGWVMLLAISCAAVGCDSDGDDDGDEDGGPQGSCGPVTASPGTAATDERRPELGEDACVLESAHVDMSAAFSKTEVEIGPVIEAKYELNDSGDLALSLYPIADMSLDAERQVFQEVSGDPTAASWAPGEPEVFSDAEHLKRSARDVTLVQISEKSLASVVNENDEEDEGFVFWAIPTIQGGRAGYGVYRLRDNGDTAYEFEDGGGADQSGVDDLGSGPGEGATDARSPEIPNLAVLTDAGITMAEAIAQAEAAGQTIIEAKLEVEDGHLSLSLYPVDDLSVDAQRQTFTELAGDPTGSSWAPVSKTFEDSDFEHLTRSSRDLTLVQTSSLSLADAVDAAAAEVPGGIVYWAIPTRRGTQPGYGVYVYDAEEQESHYLFIH